jgi:hypothetical protein
VASQNGGIKAFNPGRMISAKTLASPLGRDEHPQMTKPANQTLLFTQNAQNAVISYKIG